MRGGEGNIEIGGEGGNSGVWGVRGKGEARGSVAYFCEVKEYGGEWVYGIDAETHFSTHAGSQMGIGMLVGPSEGCLGCWGSPIGTIQ